MTGLIHRNALNQYQKISREMATASGRPSVAKRAACIDDPSVIMSVDAFMKHHGITRIPEPVVKQTSAN